MVVSPWLIQMEILLDPAIVIGVTLPCEVVPCTIIIIIEMSEQSVAAGHSEPHVRLLVNTASAPY